MNRRWFQFVVLGILAVAAITPLLEIFDRWDVVSGPWNDTEMGVTALFLGISIAVTIACLLRLAAICSFCSIVLGIFPPSNNRFLFAELQARTIHCPLPPLIPLRI